MANSKFENRVIERLAEIGTALDRIATSLESLEEENIRSSRFEAIEAICTPEDFRQVREIIGGEKIVDWLVKRAGLEFEKHEQ